MLKRIFLYFISYLITIIGLVFIILYINLFSFGYNIFEYGMLLFALISFVYLICRPNDTNTVKKILFKKFENDKKINEESKYGKIEMKNLE